MRTTALMLVTFFLAGCSVVSSDYGLNLPPTGKVFGGPSKEQVFHKFKGDWRYEDREFDPPLEGSVISGGNDITITGHIIRFNAPSTRELRLCQVREIESGIESEAWHHEDIHDPGDMQRADCKLTIENGKLVLSWRFRDSGDFSDDPVIAPSDYVPPSKTIDSNMPWRIETYTRKNAG